MALRYAVANGNFNDTNTWSTSFNGSPGASVPGSLDEAISNNRTVTITTNATVSALRADATGGATAGGSFILNNELTLNSIILGPTGGSTATLTCSAATLSGNILSPGEASGRSCVNHVAGNLNVIGSLRNNSSSGASVNGNCINSTSTGTLSITGDLVLFTTNSNAVLINSTQNSQITILGTITANTRTGGNQSMSRCIQSTTTGSITIIGNILGGTGSGVNHAGVSITNSSLVNVVGNITGGSSANANNTNHGLDLTNIQSVGIIGNITGGSSSSGTGVINNSTNSLIVTGNLLGGNGGGAAVSSSSTGASNIIGNLTGGTTGNAISTTAGTMTVISSNITPGTVAAINSSGGTLRISGNILNAANGTAAIYAPVYRIDPVPTNSYIRYARNGTGVGSDVWLYQYTTDSLSAFSMPPISAVRAGVQFANNTLTGNCQIPAPASVSFGVPVDNTVGAAVLNPVDFMNVSVASLTASDSLGARLKNSATVESVGRIIASFSN